MADKLPKEPRLPTFPPHVAPTVELLNGIIDSDPDAERRAMAYGLLTRLSVMYASPAPKRQFTVNAELVEYHEDRPEEATCRLRGNPPLVDEMMRLMLALFPSGSGLPEREGL